MSWDHGIFQLQLSVSFDGPELPCQVRPVCHCVLDDTVITKSWYFTYKTTIRSVFVGLIFFTLCTPFFILYLPSPQGNPSFSSSPVPLPHPSFSPSPLFSNSGLTDWQYFISLQVYTIARQYFCTWHGYH